jgi:hypothetical protein
LDGVQLVGDIDGVILNITQAVDTWMLQHPTTTDDPSLWLQYTTADGKHQLSIVDEKIFQVFIISHRNSVFCTVSVLDFSTKATQMHING